MTGAPLEIALPHPLPAVLGLGALLEGAVAVTDGNRARTLTGLGRLDTPEAVATLEAAARALETDLDHALVAVAHDYHPDFPGTRLAEQWPLPRAAVQHHHAHVAAVVAEHGLTGPVVGVVFDGFGLGPDNGAWGGELLQVTGGRACRRGHLFPLPQPGGDAAARAPWRMGAAALFALDRGAEIPHRFHPSPEAALLPQVLARGVACPPTSSAGRLFDAACGLLDVTGDGLRPAPAVLEAQVTQPRVLPGGWRLSPEGVLDLRPLLTALADGVADGPDLFHGTLAAAVVAWVHACVAEDLPVVLAGGCFHNRVLTALVRDGLAAHNRVVLLPRRLPPGDGAIALGQVWAAAWALAENLPFPLPCEDC